MAQADLQRRLDAAHRAIQILVGQAQASADLPAVAAALDEDGEAAAEVLAATGRLPANVALLAAARRVDDAGRQR